MIWYTVAASAVVTLYTLWYWFWATNPQDGLASLGRVVVLLGAVALIALMWTATGIYYLVT